MFQVVDVLVCRRFGLSTFWLSTFRFVAILTSYPSNHEHLVCQHKAEDLEVLANVLLKIFWERIGLLTTGTIQYKFNTDRHFMDCHFFIDEHKVFGYYEDIPYLSKKYILIEIKMSLKICLATNDPISKSVWQQMIQSAYIYIYVYIYIYTLGKKDCYTPGWCVFLWLFIFHQSTR